jgi:hypothetical protein
MARNGPRGGAMPRSILTSSSPSNPRPRIILASIFYRSANSMKMCDSCPRTDAAAHANGRADKNSPGVHILKSPDY